LKVGVQLPLAAPWDETRRLAELAEAAGLDSLWFPDHLIGRFGGPPVVVWECWALVTAVAAATRRIQIGTLVVCTGFRNPALLAKMADTVDEISGGRLILGLGAGWHEPEFRAFGYPYDHRVSRFEEAFAIVRALLREGRVDFAGRFHEARDCELLPRGPRPAGPPLMVGTKGERMLRLAAARADLWNGCWFAAPAELAPVLERVDAACADVGRDPATLGRTAGVFVDLPGRIGRPLPTDVPVSDSPAAVADLLHGFAAEGVAHAQVWLDPLTPDTLETFARAAELLDRA
jgi:alkanesulfonate monooxygenase SsuD/methylene tetrahydromethanopterin reductase-like flavin-dependent oxidoreductase (luciferase family)